MKRTIARVALIGLGKVAESHLLAYQGLADVSIVGVADIRPARRADIAKRYGVPAFDGLEELLQEGRPEVACILTPASTHRELTEKCAAAGVHVLCEKPMALTVEDARAMADACRRARVEFFYGSSYRYLPTLQEARRLIGAGAIGSVRLMVEEMVGGRGAEAFTPLTGEHYPPGGPGGGGYGLVDHGIHMLDVMPWLCGSKVATVCGRGDRTGSAPRPECALLLLQSGALGVLLYDGSTWPTALAYEGVYGEGRRWLDDRGWMGDTGQWDNCPANLHVYGSAGAMRIFPYANKLYVTDSRGSREIRVPEATTPWHFGEQLKSFLGSLSQGAPPATSAEDGISALSALLAAYTSEESNRWVTVTTDECPGPDTVRNG